MKTPAGRTTALAFCLLAAFCQSPVVPSLPLDDLLAAPLSVEISGRQFRLETDVWRNMMPSFDPDGSRLIVAAYITAVDGQPFPAELDGTRVWVINGEEVWETGLTEEARPRDSAHLNQLAKIAREGPKWDVGILVEVVVRVVASGDVPRLLRATKQLLNGPE